MLVGLSIGLSVAWVVYLQSGRPQAEPPTAARSSQPVKEARTEPMGRLPLPTPVVSDNAGGQAGPSEPDTVPAEPDTRAASAARFEFYESLADFEVVVPQSANEQRALIEQRAATEQDTGRQPDAAPSAASADTPRFMIQAGSFRAVTDADSRKASLAMLGIESELYRVNLDDGVYHRVMIGPISERAEYNRITQRLAEARIKTMTIALGD